VKYSNQNGDFIELHEITSDNCNLLKASKNMALILVHIPSGNWMNIMIHIMLLTTLVGLAINEKQNS